VKIGFVVEISDRGPNAPRRYTEIRDSARRAEDLGLDSVWVYDHLVFRHPEKPTQGIWECLTVLSALAEATTRIELGTLVVCTQFRNPAVLAKMAVTLDEVSNGRFTLGVGAGWHQPEFTAFGIPFDHRVSRFAEALQIIHPLLKEGRVDFAGQFYQARDCEIAPRGPSPNGPPLLIAASGPKMIELTARYADLWATSAATPAALAERRSELAAAGSVVGRDTSSVGLAIDPKADFPELDDPPRTRAAEKSLAGSAEEIAAQLAAFRDAGLAHLLLETSPTTPPALARLARAVELFRATGR
jgi:probable F420-dependent oxidoreductase